MDQKHKLELVKKYDTGATEWQCKICSRRLIMQTTPFKSITLSKGDFNAIHFGGQVSITIGTQDFSSSPHPKDDITHH